jgi:hypothetical protein
MISLTVAAFMLTTARQEAQQQILKKCVMAGSGQTKATTVKKREV